MNVSTVIGSNFIKINTIERTFMEVIPYSPPEKTLPATLLNFLKRGNDKDALQAVKQDPAVLEAQVTVDTARKDPENLTAVRNFDLESKKKDTKPKCYPSFEEVLSMQQAALLGLTPQQLDLLVAFVDTLRQQRVTSQKYLECAFCKNNGEPVSWYSSHVLKDWRGRVRCPVLRAFRCPRCGASGDRAHTNKYCPENLFSDFRSCP